jgi:hypothetical protein
MAEELKTIEVEGLGFFEVPVSMTDDEFGSLLQSQFGKPTEALPDPDVPTIYSSLENQVGSAVAGSRQATLVPPQDARTLKARSLREQFGDNTRLASLAAGGAIGAEMANRNFQSFDPRIRAAATVAGGALGTMIGSMGNDVIRETPTSEAVINALKEGQLDATYGVAVPAVVRTLGYLGGQTTKALGIDTVMAEKLLQVSERIGAKIGPVDVARAAPVKGVKTVLGVFPWVGSPFRKANQKTQKAVVDALDQYLNIAGPNASLSSIGVDMTKAAENTFSEFKGVSNALYKKFDDMAELTGAVVPTSAIKQAALDASGRIRLPQGVPEGDPTAVKGFLEGLRELPDQIPVQELRGIQMRLSELFEDAGNIEMRRLMMVKKGSEEALSSISTAQTRYEGINGDPTQALRGMLDKANSFYAAGMRTFENPTASKFGRVDKNIFRTGSFKAANLNPDEIAELGMNFRSPDAVRDLKALVGEENVRKGFRAHLQRSIDSAIEQTGEQTFFNFSKLRNAFGAGPNKTISREAVDEVLKGTSISSTDFLRVLDLAEQVGKVPLASTFIARRATFGGAKSGAKALLGISLTGGAMGMAPTESVIGFALARLGANALQSPRVLRAMVKASDPALNNAQAQTQAMRLLSMVLEMRPTTPDQTGLNQAELDEYIRSLAPQ